MAEATTKTKTRRGRPRTATGVKRQYSIVYRHDEWLDWLYRLAAVERTGNASVIVDRALADYAARVKFEPPPRRL